ncbi:MAG: helix-turn-helix transcriptional regulator [Myxococcales bacterium]|nr:helix-turn-helix transcriptional regulator [Myxococcales bacterium]
MNPVSPKQEPVATDAPKSTVSAASPEAASSAAVSQPAAASTAPPRVDNDSSGTTSARAAPRSRSGASPNNVRKLRQAAMMSKAELARRAGVSPLTINRVESGHPCRMDTKRKILEALGLDPTARQQVFPDVD